MANLVKVPIRFPYVDPLLCKLRVSDPADPTLDVEELAHIPGAKKRSKIKQFNSQSDIHRSAQRHKLVEVFSISGVDESYPSVSMAYLYFVPSSLS